MGHYMAISSSRNLLPILVSSGTSQLFLHIDWWVDTGWRSSLARLGSDFRVRVIGTLIYRVCWGYSISAFISFLGFYFARLGYVSMTRYTSKGYVLGYRKFSSIYPSSALTYPPTIHHHSLLLPGYLAPTCKYLYIPTYEVSPTYYFHHSKNPDR